MHIHILCMSQTAHNSTPDNSCFHLISECVLLTNLPAFSHLPAHPPFWHNVLLQSDWFLSFIPLLNKLHISFLVPKKTNAKLLNLPFDIFHSPTPHLDHTPWGLSALGSQTSPLCKPGTLLVPDLILPVAAIPLPPLKSSANHESTWRIAFLVTNQFTSDCICYSKYIVACWKGKACQMLCSL